MPRFHQLPACTFLVLAMAGTHHATEPPSLEKVLSFPTRGESPASILSTGFDTPEERAAKRPPGFQVVPGQGRNGTACLFYQRSDPDAYPLCSVPLPGTADGASHQLKLWIRTEAIEVHGSDHNIGAVCVEYGRDGKWSGGAYFKLDQPSPEWRQITLPFTPPEGVRASLQFYLRRGITGRIWFDDVEIRDAGITHEVLITRPDRLTFFGDQRQIRFRVSGQVPPSALLLVTTKNAGRTQDLLLSGDGGIYHASLAPLEPGPVEITARIADAEAGEFIGSGSFQLQARPPATPPANACLIDPHGRAVVDGKPFMPLGVYGFADESNYRRLAADGFNCIQLYGSLSLRGREKTADPYRDLLAGMDLIDGAGLKLIFSLKDQFPHHPSARHTFGPTKGIDAVSAAVVETVRGHPALLAWYVSDEETRDKVPEVVNLRRRISTIDPWHPTWTLTYRYGDLPYYGVSGDVIGVDPYPISERHEPKAITKVKEAMIAARSTGLPCWVVPQIFNWGVYHLKDDPEAFRASRFPTMVEMRAMSLYAAMLGARGFVFYSNTDILLRYDRLWPGSGEREWPKVVQTASALRRIEPYILGTTPGPAVTVTQTHGPPGTVEAGTLADEDGHFCTIIVATGEGSEAEIEVAGRKPLHSAFGNTRPLGNGRYLFKATGVDADILLEAASTPQPAKP